MSRAPAVFQRWRSFWSGIIREAREEMDGERLGLEAYVEAVHAHYLARQARAAAKRRQHWKNYA